MKQIFLTDIDGTLIKTGSPIHRYVKQAVHGYISSGGYFSLVTGRAKIAADSIARELSVNAPCLFLGGAYCFDFQLKRPLWTIPLDPRADELLHLVWRQYPEVSITVYTDNEIFNLRLNDRLLTRGVFEDRTAPLSCLSAITGTLMKVLLTCDDTSVLQEISHLHVDHGLFNFAAASKHFYELTPCRISKGIAAKMLCEHISRGEDYQLIVAGDAHTDLTMRPFADLFYAPVTASDEIKRVADMCFADPLTGGLAEVIFDHTPPY